MPTQEVMSDDMLWGQQLLKKTVVQLWLVVRMDGLFAIDDDQ
jgi:hypothetical protein